MRKSFTLIVLFSVLVITGLAQSNSPVVISQVYGGGGNASATYQNDFIELYNRSSNSVALTGYSIQYASATGANFISYNLPVITLQAGQYYLIAGGSSGALGSVLPAADFTISQNLGATAGRVALSSSATALSGSSCFASGTVVDLIGYGSTAVCFEGAGPAPAPSNTTADVRQNSGTLDGNNNNLDFLAQTPNPRNTSSSFGPVVALPVSLHYFAAIKTSTSIDLKWKTANEENASWFVIEKSKDGNVFTEIGTVAAIGRPNEYSYTDKTPLPNINFYRVKLVSRDRTYLNSPVVSVKMGGKEVAQVYPNPATSQLMVQFTSNGQEKLLVQDAAGRILKISSLSSAGVIIMPVDISGLSKGTYFISLGNHHLRFIKL